MVSAALLAALAVAQPQSINQTIGFGEYWAKFREPPFGTPATVYYAQLGAEAPLADAVPSVANLPSTLTGLSCMDLVLRCEAPDATADDWACTGGTLAIAGAGAAPTLDAGSPLMGTADTSVQFAGGGGDKYYSGAVGGIGTEDFIIEAVFDATADRGILAKRTTAGYKLFASGGSMLLFLDDGPDTTQIGTGALTAGAATHALWLADRSGSAIAYDNAVAGSAVSITSIGSLTDAANLFVGRDDVGREFDQRLYYFAVWKDTAGAGCLTTHLQPTLAAERYMLLAGQYAQKSGGSNVPTFTRATTATLRKYEDGATKLYTVGAGWPRVESGPDGVLGNLAEAASSNVALQSQDISTSWTESNAADTASLDAIEAPDGTTTADGSISDATDTTHCYSQAMTMTAATWACSLKSKAGVRTKLYLSNDSVANADSYFDATGAATCAQGTECAAGKLTKGVGATTAFAQNYGDGWARYGISFTALAGAGANTITFCAAEADGDHTFAGDGAAIDAYWWALQCEAQTSPTSYIATTTGAGTRNTDQLQPDTTNWPTGSGTLSATYVPSSAINTGRQHYLFDGTTRTTDTGLLLVRDAGGALRCRMYSDAPALVGDASATGLTWVAGQAYDLMCKWNAGLITVYRDGVALDTDVPSATHTGWSTDRFGHSSGTNESAFGTLSKHKVSQ
jgi:hypothetical protein